MIGQFIKKQFLIMIRNKQELLLLLVMPFTLISILGFALTSVMDSKKMDILAKVAIVEHGNEQEDFEKFANDVKNVQMPDEEKEFLLKQVEKMMPISILKQEILGSKELEPYIQMAEFQPSELEEIRENDKYTVIVEVPEHFSYTLLNHLIFGEKTKPKLSIYVNEGKEITAQFVQELITEFQEQYSLISKLDQAGLNESLELPVAKVKGEMETVTKREPINSFTYYTVGISVMFVLYLASYISSHALQEKQSNAFHRLLLANVPKNLYMAAIFITSLIIAFFQLSLLYALAAVFYSVKWPDLVSFIIVTLALCVAVGGIGTFLTSLSYRINSDNVSIFFSSGVVSILAFLGGSYFPVSQMSEFMHKLGDMTPNGAGMTAYLKILQGYDLSQFIWPVIYLCLFGFVMFVLSLLVFPKRGEMA
ncbi:MAG: ABC transporter permease [Bacillaceae bacterium]|uniref:ABC transporter permease n=1 Tax=Aeribacillus composti TaxID=1868734 RepID=UPI000E37D54B|nr:ABC transporter permease [Aeribacillus composti]MED0745240.1 ABC transporter permease [Aeribacillus composti]REJ24515.1 MAG: ABC transporter permease [Bacillaceae bacterium]